MDGLPCKKDNYCAAPMCLLYVNLYMELIPIAIQLKRKPAADNPIFLPTDCRNDWILAKMYFSNANAQVTTSLSEVKINVIHDNCLYFGGTVQPFPNKSTAMSS